MPTYRGAFDSFGDYTWHIMPSYHPIEENINFDPIYENIVFDNQSHQFEDGFDLDEFRKGSIYVICESNELARDFCNFLYANDFMWCNSDSLLNNWTGFNEQCFYMSYHIRLTYAYNGKVITCNGVRRDNFESWSEYKKIVHWKNCTNQKRLKIREN